jgi:hypothetical protein
MLAAVVVQQHLFVLAPEDLEVLVVEEVALTQAIEKQLVHLIQEVEGEPAQIIQLQ